jgi:RNA polymerase sigma factor (sigma-70 family)
LNEQELIQQLRQGNEPAFRWLVENYRSRIFHTVLNIVQDSKEAEDAAQETFIQVFESVGAFKEESSLSTWIYRIAVRKALDKIRRRKTRQRLHKILSSIRVLSLKIKKKQRSYSKPLNHCLRNKSWLLH